MIGFHISKNGIAIQVHPVVEEISDDFCTLISGQFSKQEIIDLITDFTNKNLQDIQIFAASISFPGPIENDSVTIPNYWREEQGYFSKQDFIHLKIAQSEFQFINEMEALGHGLLSVDEFSGLEDDFVPLWKPPAEEAIPTLYPLFFSSEASCALQISHGLGAAFIIPYNSNDAYRVIPSEFGHATVQISGPEEPSYIEEQNLIDFIFAKINSTVEWEDICSTRGLAACFLFVTKKSFTTENIISYIEKNPSDLNVKKAVALHFRFLMRFARLCSVVFKCSSVFVHYSVFSGGVQTLLNNSLLCRDEFMHYTKSEWVSKISVFVQISKNNLSGNGVMYHALLRTSRCEDEY